MSNYIYYAVFLLLVLASSFSQIILKSSANENKKGFRIFLNPKVIGAYIILFNVMLFVAMLYRFIPLSIGVLLESSGYIFVLFMSGIFLGERITPRKIVGVFLIILGISASILI